MQYALTFVAFAAPALISAHGAISSPKPRSAGKAMAAACGQQVQNQQSSDAFGNIQGELQVVGKDMTADCNLWLCKGFQFDDNSANVQSFTTGQKVPITFDLRAPHTGTANISIVDTKSNSIIGEPLKTYDTFASNSAPQAADEKSVTVTIPDLGGKCATAGECVIQHYWDARSIDQTYESCIDFTVGGGGAGAAAPAPSAAAPTTSAAANAPAPTTLATQTRTATSAPAAGGDAPATGGSGAALYAQCGGNGFTGASSCAEGTCKKQNDYYSQCVPN
ncbi:chitin binding protein [Apiospora phragmitis]|uniref:Chitin binding protein n=1 Tax=Apiospora phragmitis TaxID=2905665 RepID=A0ABR1X5U1_9PEZI